MPLSVLRTRGVSLSGQPARGLGRGPRRGRAGAASQPPAVHLLACRCSRFFSSSLHSPSLFNSRWTIVALAFTHSREFYRSFASHSFIERRSHSPTPRTPYFERLTVLAERPNDSLLQSLHIQKPIPPSQNALLCCFGAGHRRSQRSCHPSPCELPRPPSRVRTTVPVVSAA